MSRSFYGYRDGITNNQSEQTSYFLREPSVAHLSPSLTQAIRCNRVRVTVSSSAIYQIIRGIVQNTRTRTHSIAN